MKTATGLTAIAIGAILAFAVTAHPSGIDLQLAGLIIMVTAIAGMLMPSRASGWLRRRILLAGQLPGLQHTAGLQHTPDPQHTARLLGTYSPGPAQDLDISSADPDQDTAILASQVLEEAELLAAADLPADLPVSGGTRPILSVVPPVTPEVGSGSDLRHTS